MNTAVISLVVVAIFCTIHNSDNGDLPCYELAQDNTDVLALLHESHSEDLRRRLNEIRREAYEQVEPSVDEKIEYEGKR